jgi:hypothetical protein
MMTAENAKRIVIRQQVSGASWHQLGKEYADNRAKRADIKNKRSTDPQKERDRNQSMMKRTTHRKI